MTTKLDYVLFSRRYDASIAVKEKHDRYDMTNDCAPKIYNGSNVYLSPDGAS